MAIIAKNTTGVQKTWGGIDVSAASQYTVQQVDIVRFLTDPTFKLDLQSGDAVINDGTQDLNAVDAVFWMSGYLPSAIKLIGEDLSEVQVENGRLKLDVQFSGDQLLKVSSNDQTSGYLEGKIVGQAGKVTVSTLNDGGDEDLRITIGTDVFDKTVDTASQVVNTPAGNITSTDIQTAINELDSEKQALSEKGQANGYTPLGADSKVPSIYLPSFVDDVIEYANLAAFPVTGETGKIYVALDTNKTYRWSGSLYIEISPSEVNSVFGRTGIVTAQSGDYAASQITNTPSGGISATTAQAAINELDSEKADKTITISAGAGLSGGGDLSTNRTISMPNVGTAGTYGSASAVSIITTDAQGRVSNAVSTAISIVSSAVTDFATAVRSTVLTGFSVGTKTAIVAGDSILQAFGKIQAYLNDMVSGPASSTDNAIARFDGTTGKLIQNSASSIDDNGGIIAGNLIRPGDTSDTTDGNIRFNNGELQVREGGVWKTLASTPTIVSSTSNASTTSGTYSVISGMTVTPPAGTYLCIFSFNWDLGNNTDGDIAFHLAGAVQANTVRNVSIAAAGFLGVTASIGGAGCIQTTLTVNGSQAIDVRFRENGGGTLTLSARQLLLIPISR